MKNNDTNHDSTMGRDILKAMLAHPGVVLVIDEDCRMQLAFADELETANS